MKCTTCGAELPLQSRFCGECGTIQSQGTNTGESGSLETIRSSQQAENNPANTPPPPPQSQQNIGEIQKRSGEIFPPSQEENKPQTTSSTGQPNNPPSDPHPPTIYDDRQQFQQSQPLQQPPSSYQQTPYVDYQQQSSPYGNYQQPPQPYGNYQQPPQPYGNYQQPPLAYGNYQQPPLAQPPYINLPPTQHFGDYQTPPQPSGSYQQLPQPLPPGIHAELTAANTNPSTTGATPLITGAMPIPTGTQSKVPVWRKWAIIGIVAVVILAGSGVLLAHFLIPPPLVPVISVISKYFDNGTPAGSGGTTDGTTLQVTGNQFAANSAITFFLDNTAIRQDMQAVTNASGKFSTDLQVTSAWSLGQHKLTAQDASKNTTNNSTTISIVQQGYNVTPGPNGSPTNTANFKITADFHMQSANKVTSNQLELDITGQSDSQGGTVCAPGDDGSQHKYQFTLSNGTTVNEVYTFTCSGTYKGGHLTYNDALDTDVYSDAGGSCSLTGSQPSYIQMTGNYTTEHQFSGDIIVNSINGSQYTCTGDLTFNGSTAGGTGTWTGTVSNS